MSLLTQLLEAALSEIAAQSSTKNQRKQNRDFKAEFEALLNASQQPQTPSSKTKKPKDDFINLEQGSFDDRKDLFEGKKGLIEQQKKQREHFYDDDAFDMRHEKSFSKEQSFEVHDFSQGDDLGVGLSLEEQATERNIAPTHPLLEKLRNPANVRDAIIISEILRRR